jgi:hypothetical protein
MAGPKAEHTCGVDILTGGVWLPLICGPLCIFSSWPSHGFAPLVETMYCSFYPGHACPAFAKSFCPVWFLLPASLWPLMGGTFVYLGLLQNYVSSIERKGQSDFVGRLVHMASYSLA